MATMSILPVSVAAPRGTLPLMISTLLMSWSGKMTPRNERPPLNAGTGNEPTLTPPALKKLREAFAEESTSENTAPNPVVVAGMPPFVPGTKKPTFVSVLPVGENRRGSLKVRKLARLGLLKFVARPDGGAWMKPVPGARVVNWAPRMFWNPLSGVGESVVA